MVHIENRINSLMVTKPREDARVLVLDDEADIRFTLTRILQLEGYTATEAASGSEALNYLANAAFDLMILDMRMPGMSGVEVMECIEQTYPEMLIVILTGQATLESAIVATRSNNVIDYLLKPVTNEEFLQAVKNALKKRSEQLRQQQLIDAASKVLDVVDPAETSVSAPVENDSPSPNATSGKMKVIQAYPLTLDCQKRLATLTNDPTHIIELTRGEAAVLSCLMRNANQILSCYDLVSTALGYESNLEEAESVIRPYIFRLRRKIEPSPQKPRLIRTIRRKGYRFVSPTL